MNVVKILHVEDVPEDYEQIDRILKKSGLSYESICVSTKAGFIHALDTFMPDIILCDHSLPTFDSISAAKILSSKDLKTPIILVTGTLSENYISDVLKAGIVDYVLKDRPLRLPAAIKSALEKYNLERKKDIYFKTIIDQEKRFRSLIENLSEAIVLVDKSGKIIYHSPSAARLTGIKNEEVLGQNVFSFIHPDDLNGALSSFKKCGLQPRCTLEDSFRVRTDSGGYLWVEGSITNLLDDVAINGFIINYRNVTDRKIAQQQLAESEANLRAIFNNTETSYVFLSTSFEVLSYNVPASNMHQIIGKGFEIGKNLVDFLPENRREYIKEKLKRVLGGERISYETIYESDNNKVWFSIRLLPVLNDKKEVIGVIVAGDDITSRKLTELEREKITNDLIIHVKNLEQFAYIVSHNLRSPVANIIGLSAMLQETSSLSAADRKRCLQGLSMSAEKLDEIIKDLNHILQVRSDVNETKEQLKISSLVKDIVRSFQKIIDTEKISVITDFRNCDEIVTVRSYLYSILYNLFSNSIKYRQREQPCVIEIRTELSDKKIRIICSDNGLGIDLETHSDKIFGLYKKFHTHIEGKGIGLYMVKTQVEMLGGTIEVESKVNQGSTFSITLPIQN